MKKTKNCNKCIFYKKNSKKCNKYKMLVIETDIFALACKEYTGIKIKKVKCKDCINMNKYTWCSMKKRCFNEIERNKDRQCRYYFKRKIRSKKEKY